MKLSVTIIDETIRTYFWLKPESDAIVNEAVKRGYCIRCSHTQAQWTEAGLELARKELVELDYYGNVITYPEIGEKVLRDGYVYKVDRIIGNKDIHIVASITLRGPGGVCEVGYYDYLVHRAQFVKWDRLQGITFINAVKMKAIKKGGYHTMKSEILAACQVFKDAYGIDHTPKHLL